MVLRTVNASGVIQCAVNQIVATTGMCFTMGVQCTGNQQRHRGDPSPGVIVLVGKPAHENHPEKFLTRRPAETAQLPPESFDYVAADAVVKQFLA
jgi:hypothetical protein